MTADAPEIRIPIYERAEIRPLELAKLLHQLQEAERQALKLEETVKQLAQAEGERDAIERALATLYSGLGLDPEDWGVSESSAQEAVQVLLGVVSGQCRREACEPVPAGSVLARLLDLLEPESKGRVYPLRRERRGR